MHGKIMHMQIHQAYHGYSAPAQDARVKLADARATVVGGEGGGRQPASSEQVVAFIEQVLNSESKGIGQVTHLPWQDGKTNLFCRRLLISAYSSIVTEA